MLTIFGTSTERAGVKPRELGVAQRGRRGIGVANAGQTGAGIDTLCQLAGLILSPRKLASRDHRARSDAFIPHPSLRPWLPFGWAGQLTSDDPRSILTGHPGHDYDSIRSIQRASRSDSWSRSPAWSDSRLANSGLLPLLLLSQPIGCWACAALLLAMFVVITTGGETSADDAEPAAPAAAVEFLRDVKPIFVRHCYGCHGPGEERGGLSLARHDLALAER